MEKKYKVYSMRNNKTKWDSFPFWEFSTEKKADNFAKEMSADNPKSKFKVETISL